MEQFSPIKKKRSSQLIADQIKDLIERGVYKPGDKLPSDRSMSESFQVSRTVIRETISSLEASGIVDVRPGVGVFLKTLSSQVLIKELSRLVIPSKDELFEVLELRRGLEKEIVVLAIERGTEEDMQNIEEAFLKMELKMKRFEIALEEDLNFHIAIAEAAHNLLILKVFNFIVDHYKMGLEEARKISVNSAEQNESIIDSHKRLYEAIRNRDETKALAALGDLLGSVYKKLKT